MSVDSAADLYGLPLDRFVPVRAALAKSLRGSGNREEADRVAALRKPTVAAWAVNQLVRTQSRAVAELLDAGDALSRAQSEVLAGRGGAQTLRESTLRQRAAVEQLLEAARGLLTADGHELAPATIDRVADTLRAATLDEGARAAVRDGCLTRELRHVGIGETTGVVAPPAPPNVREDGAAKGNSAMEARAAASGRRESAADPGQVEAAHWRAADLSAARKAEADARKAAERCARELDDAQARRDRAADALRDAEEDFAAALARADRATAHLDAAKRVLDRLR